MYDSGFGSRARALALSVLALAFTACGGDDGKASTDGGSTGGTCRALVGSCLPDSHAACVDFTAPTTTEIGRQACEAHGDATWSSAGCSHTGAAGGCRLATGGGGCTTDWFFAPTTAADVMTLCAQQNGTFVTP
jgi:hypothetical protein